MIEIENPVPFTRVPSNPLQFPQKRLVLIRRFGEAIRCYVISTRDNALVSVAALVPERRLPASGEIKREMKAPDVLH